MLILSLLLVGTGPAQAQDAASEERVQAGALVFKKCMLEGKEINKANFIVVDPRLTRTAAHANEFVRIRPGTDIPVLMGMMWHIFKNGWEDKDFIKQRVHGFEQARKEIDKWNPQEVERVSGVPGEQLERVAKLFATEKPATLLWSMGATSPA